METPPINNQEEKKPNSLKSEHLMEGIKPIIACIGTMDQYDSDLNKFILSGNDIDYYTLKEYRDEKFLGTDDHGYVISNIDSSMKFTEHLYGCTSIVAVGKDSKTGENISFLTHQDPYRTLQDHFQKDLEKRLNSLKAKCQNGTVDIIMVGGQNVPDRMKAMSYQDSVDALNKVVKGVFDFDPVVVCGPKHSGGQNAYDNVYFDTENRRLYVVRPKDHIVYNDSFVAGDLPEVNERWKDKK